MNSAHPMIVISGRTAGVWRSPGLPAPGAAAAPPGGIGLATLEPSKDT
ncbi:hypothetical protein [uncultured Thiodictyon sp.]|nr:hypothetical protein [uncultured Thiodictyon sp.]